MAKLNFYYGAMNCGKSDNMISTAYNYTESGLDIVTAMPAKMMRKPGLTTSRAGKEWPIDIRVEESTDLRQAFVDESGDRAIKAFLIDEASFLTSDQVDDLEKIAKYDKISVVAYGLRSDVQRHLFEGAARLFELADVLHKMPTMCSCGSQAEFNGRFVEGNFHVGEPIEWVDNDPDKVRYQSMCADCYLENYTSPGAVVR